MINLNNNVIPNNFTKSNTRVEKWGKHGQEKLNKNGKKKREKEGINEELNKQETVIKHKSKVTRTRGKTRKFTKKRE